jgi:hypothetical protein
VQLWVPELGGPIDFGDSEQMAAMQYLCMKAKQEVWFTTARVITSMKAQARDEGRFLGGRPPYGYRLAAVGPHPNKTFAGWGRKQHGLEPDPDTAPWAQWIFAQRLAGRSVAAITRELNERRVACPSLSDAARNRHRRKDGWYLTTVSGILGNLVYTGLAVWNRQYTEHAPADPMNLHRNSRKDVRRRNTPDKWVISHALAHEPLVSVEDFVAVQKVRVAPKPQDGSARTYLLGGLIRCELCGRKMDSHWVNGRPGYRCRHGQNSSRQPLHGRPKTLYLREDRVPAELAATVASEGRHRWADAEAMLRNAEATITAGPGGVRFTVTVPAADSLLPCSPGKQ